MIAELLCTAAAAALYLNTLDADFCYDDRLKIPTFQSFGHQSDARRLWFRPSVLTFAAPSSHGVLSRGQASHGPGPIPRGVGQSSEDKVETDGHGGGLVPSAQEREKMASLAMNLRPRCHNFLAWRMPPVLALPLAALPYTEELRNLEVALANISRQLGHSPRPEPEPQVASSYPLIAFCNQ
ncbi:hypothetical protein D4764_22G0003440 [Takifugu flavidus]|uniref:Uncharacterized protein n=1 Tax=Takifugu flavidus TaxID=433684 RepID=A0A5C6NGL7_9TELE|nr:hypothetical protein D4764_22G0003440 [Takifugu flavidus]